MTGKSLCKSLPSICCSREFAATPARSCIMQFTLGICITQLSAHRSPCSKDISCCLGSRNRKCRNIFHPRTSALIDRCAHLASAFHLLHDEEEIEFCSLENSRSKKRKHGQHSKCISKKMCGICNAATGCTRYRLSKLPKQVESNKDQYQDDSRNLDDREEKEHSNSRSWTECCECSGCGSNCSTCADHWSWRDQPLSQCRHDRTGDIKDCKPNRSQPILDRAAEDP